MVLEPKVGMPGIIMCGGLLPRFPLPPRTPSLPLEPCRGGMGTRERVVVQQRTGYKTQRLDHESDRVSSTNRLKWWGRTRCKRRGRGVF